MAGNDEPNPFDIWFEGTFALFDAAGPYGRFSSVNIGADYLVTPDLLLGGFVSFDRIEQFDILSTTTVAGSGWMVGPYLTARLTDTVYLDVLAAAGTAQNTIDQGFGLVDTFGSNRWLVDASLTGAFDTGPWRFEPRLSVSYAEETSQAYVVGFGTNVPSVTAGIGRITVGPGISHTSTIGTLSQTLSLRLDAVKSFGAVNAFSARTEAGADWRLDNGLSLGLSGFYSGLGETHQSTGVSIKAGASF